MTIKTKVRGGTVFVPSLPGDGDGPPPGGRGCG